MRRPSSAQRRPNSSLTISATPWPSCSRPSWCFTRRVSRWKRIPCSANTLRCGRRSRSALRGAHFVNATMNDTHDPQRQSWVASANRPGVAFPIQNLPFGVFAGARGRRLALPLAIRFSTCAVARACSPRGGARGLCRRHAESAHGARPGVLVGSARRLSDLLRADHPRAAITSGPWRPICSPWRKPPCSSLP